MAKSPTRRPGAKTNAERQAAYRARHLTALDGDGERLNMVVTVQAKAQLTRLAAHYAVTRRHMLARLLGEAERALLDSLSRAQQAAYYRATDVTP